jgi:hypothetical protein
MRRGEESYNNNDNFHTKRGMGGCRIKVAYLASLE